MSQVCVILADQLSMSLSSLSHIDKKSDLVVLFEIVDVKNQVPHHQKKLVFLLSAMRHFAKELTAAGYHVHYVPVDDSDHTGTLCGEISRLLDQQNISDVHLTMPSEYNDFIAIQGLFAEHTTQLHMYDDDRFMCAIEEFKEFAGQKKQLRMEFFYRYMRKKYNILMSGGEPLGGKWNYDSDNRKKIGKGVSIPKPYAAPLDEITQEVVALVTRLFSDHWGDIHPFHYALTREGALAVLTQFINERLSDFGDYQDAMVEKEDWLFHSHISFYLNAGLLVAKECIQAVESAYLAGKCPLNSAEGFIRQILGWREYVRGIYWLKMPEYRDENFFNAKRSLPSVYWGAPTKMNCMRECVRNTKENAYAHHIQRLMVLGNFALLAGLAPSEVNRWYWLVYMDAYEWVELPNVSGMILFADGGYLASKPYAAGGSYINKMSDYCRGCQYHVKEKTGDEACPFNYLYWDFLLRHTDKLKSNPRLAMMYRQIEKMPAERIDAITTSAQKFLEQLTDEKES